MGPSRSSHGGKRAQHDGSAAAKKPRKQLDLHRAYSTPSGYCPSLLQGELLCSTNPKTGNCRPYVR
jgi:hypothetical protein